MGSWGNVRGGRSNRWHPPPTPVVHHASADGWGGPRTWDPRGARTHCLPEEASEEAGRPRDGAVNPVPVNPGNAPACGRPGRGGGSLFPAAPPLPEGSVVVCWRRSVCPPQAPAPDQGGGKPGAGGTPELWGQPLPPPQTASPPTKALGGLVWGGRRGQCRVRLP